MFAEASEGLRVVGWTPDGSGAGFQQWTSLALLASGLQSLLRRLD